VLLCATDPGGVANLAPLVAPLRERGRRVVALTLASQARAFGSADERLTGVNPGDVEAVIARYAPAAIVCGTTRFASPDRSLIGAARRRGVRVTAVIDERFAYRQRFALDGGEVGPWPDAVTVLDAASVEEAVSEGVPPDILHVTGSPALARTVGYARAFVVHPPARPPWLPEGLPIVVFASETLTADYGTGPDAPGPLGPFIGYTEATVLAALREALDRMGVACTVVEKLHPSASDSAEAAPEPGLRVRDVPLWPLMWHAHAVVGMRSMALLDARLLGVPALSFQPGLLGPERCTAVRLGLASTTGRADDAAMWVRRMLTPTVPAHRPPSDAFEFAPPDAADRVVRVALAERA
jgi:hypothetical protein